MKLVHINKGKVTGRSLLLITLIFISFHKNIFSQDFGIWSSATPMNLDRSDFASVVLPDGNILVTGGNSSTANTITNTCEIYNYKTNTWSYVANMNIPRGIHQLVLLDSNRVLAVGGYQLKSCEVYIINEDKWIVTDSLKVMRYFGWTSSKLNNGEVLVAGGYSFSSDSKTSFFLNDVEIYDPLLNNWRETDSLKIGRRNHTATLLNNGNLLISGGVTNNGIELNDCEIFDTALETWTIADSLNTARYYHSAILLQNGDVLVSGGSNYTNPTAAWLNSCEIYDPINNKWKTVTSMVYARNHHSSIILNNNYVLFTGGNFGSERWELYDPVLFKNIYYNNFPIVQFEQRIEKLTNGSVISMGGYTWRDSSLPVVSATAMCEIYQTTTSLYTEFLNNPYMFELFQNYPNPFNPETIISFKVSELSFVTLKVYDLLGRKVTTLVNEERTAGTYKIKFKANNLPSGTYFYKLSTIAGRGNQFKTKKMILLK